MGELTYFYVNPHPFCLKKNTHFSNKRRSLVVFSVLLCPFSYEGHYIFQFTVYTTSSSLFLNFWKNSALLQIKTILNQAPVSAFQMLGFQVGFGLIFINLLTFIEPSNYTTFNNLGNILKVFFVFIQSLTNFWLNRLSNFQFWVKMMDSNHRNYCKHFSFSLFVGRWGFEPQIFVSKTFLLKTPLVFSLKRILR